MNPKEKEAEKELNSQETENIAEEQLQEETTDQEAPLTKEEELSLIHILNMQKHSLSGWI